MSFVTTVEAYQQALRKHNRAMGVFLKLGVYKWRDHHFQRAARTRLALESALGALTGPQREAFGWKPSIFESSLVERPLPTTTPPLTNGASEARRTAKEIIAENAEVARNRKMMPVAQG